MIRKCLFDVGQRVKFRDPLFEDGEIHVVTRVIEECINGRPWKHKVELENGVRRYDDHFQLANDVNVYTLDKMEVSE